MSRGRPSESHAASNALAASWNFASLPAQRAGAPQQPRIKPTPPGESLLQVLVTRGDVARRRRRELAPGQKRCLAACESRLMARQCECIALAEGHVTQGEIVRRRRHLAGAHHALPRVEAYIGQVEILRADRRAKAAERARVDHAVGLAHAHHDALVVVDLAHVTLGIGAVLLKIGTHLHAFEAVAREAAACLLPGLFFRVSMRVVAQRNSRRRRNVCWCSQKAAKQ